MVTAPLSQAALQEGLGDLFGRIFAPWEVMEPRPWAETVRRMPAEYGTTRPYSFDYAPYQGEMYDECFNPLNQEVIFMLASRLGKTETVQNVLGRTIHQRPCRIGVMWPTLGQAKKWSKDDFMGSLVEPTPELSALIGDDTGRRKSDNTILHKIFAGGLIDMVGANAPGDLRRMKARLLYGEEIDAILEQVNDEGDQLAIFKKRGAEFPDTIEIYCSYPSVKRRSRIEAKLLESDYRQWHVPCLSCGFDRWVMNRVRDLRYDADKPQLARLECPNCHNFHDDQARYKMSRLGLWIPTKEFRGKAGFQANALLWPHPVGAEKFPGGFLQVLAQQVVDAEKSNNPKKSTQVLVNTVDAETYEDDCDAKPEHSKLFLRREKYDPGKVLPAGVLAIFFFVDVQKDRVELFVNGFGRKNQAWALDYQVRKGSPLVPPTQGVWAELDRLLQTVYRHPSGKYIAITGGLVDAGYKCDQVFAFTRPRAKRGIYASRGSTSLGKPIIERRARKEGNPPAKVWHVGTHEVKDIIYQRLELDNEEANGYLHFPEIAQFHEGYFSMLVAEDSEMKKAGDGKYYRWFWADQGVRNESLDGWVGTMAAERIHRPNYDKLAAFYGEQEGTDPDAAKSEEAMAKSSTEGRSGPRRSFVSGKIRSGGSKGGGFVSGWR